LIQTQHNYTDDFRHDGIAYQSQSMQPDLRTLINSTLRNPRTLPKTGHPAATHSVFHIDHTRLSAETMIGNRQRWSPRVLKTFVHSAAGAQQTLCARSIPAFLVRKRAYLIIWRALSRYRAPSACVAAVSPVSEPT
jgi:hypothetical protein